MKNRKKLYASKGEAGEKQRCDKTVLTSTFQSFLFSISIQGPIFTTDSIVKTKWH